MASAPASVLSSSTPLWGMVQQFMLRHAGNVLRNDQAYLMESRLLRVSKTLGFSSVGEFIIATCVASPQAKLSSAMIEALTTHETMFFRDSTFWSGMQSTVLPQLLEHAARGRTVKVWCAACSTGQEPYSLAMLLREMAPQHAARFDIIATDVAEPTLKHAQLGFYTSLEVNRGMDIRRLAKFFGQATGGFQIKEELRNCITWRQHNLLGLNVDPSRCDLVLCRNVLIYFSETDRGMVLKRLIKATQSGGLLTLGATESCRDTALQVVMPGMYRKSS